MADNIELNLGSGGSTIATDDTGTAHVQWIKLMFGGDGTFTSVTSGVGLPVGVVGNASVTNAGTFATQASQSGTWTVQPGNTANTTAWKVDGSAVTQPVSLATNTPLGTIAHDAADSGAPIKIGYKAETSPKGITLVADGDRTDAYADADGIALVKLNTSGADAISESVSNTDGASTAFTNFSAVASTKNYITSYTAFRTDSGTSMAYVDLRDGTAGSVLWRIPLPPTSGSISPPYNGPCLFKTSAATALAFDVSSALTTVYISVAGYQSKI